MAYPTFGWNTYVAKGKGNHIAVDSSGIKCLKLFSFFVFDEINCMHACIRKTNLSTFEEWITLKMYDVAHLPIFKGILLKQCRFYYKTQWNLKKKLPFLYLVKPVSPRMVYLAHVIYLSRCSGPDMHQWLAWAVDCADRSQLSVLTLSCIRMWTCDIFMKGEEVLLYPLLYWGNWYVIFYYLRFYKSLNSLDAWYWCYLWWVLNPNYPFSFFLEDFIS